MNESRGKLVTDCFPARQANILVRAGLRSIGDFQDAIIQYGLRPFADYETYYLLHGPELLQAGPKAWKMYINFFEQNGFDWQSQIRPDEIAEAWGRVFAGMNSEEAQVALQQILSRT